LSKQDSTFGQQKIQDFFIVFFLRKQGADRPEECQCDQRHSGSAEIVAGARGRWRRLQLVRLGPDACDWDPRQSWRPAWSARPMVRGTSDMKVGEELNT
jgi:hypothetical protein